MNEREKRTLVNFLYGFDCNVYLSTDLSYLDRFCWEQKL